MVAERPLGRRHRFSRDARLKRESSSPQHCVGVSGRFRLPQHVSHLSSHDLSPTLTLPEWN
jgi:hypothetical protein